MKDQQSINVMHLALEPQRPYNLVPFDPERDLTESDWQNVIDYLRRRYPKPALERNLGSLEVIIAISILNRDKLPSGYPDIESLSPIRDSIEAVASKIFFPQTHSQPEEKFWKLVKDVLIATRTQSNWGVYCALTKDLKIAYPEKEKEFNLDEEAFQGMVENRDLDRIGNSWRYLDWRIYAHRTAWIRILYPERFRQIAPNHDQLQAIINELKRNRKEEQWDSLVTLAAILKIIVAEEVKVTDHGLEITMPETPQPFIPSTPPMPPRRKY